MLPRDDSTLFTLARQGLLAARFAVADTAERRALLRELYAVTWPIVFGRITRPAESKRGHHRCARGFDKLMPDCADRFHDDVAAVIGEIVRRTTRPVADLEAWIAATAKSATVDAHRRRRGEIGALQRPRLAGWLRQELAGDEWLCLLAVHVLEWVGVPTTAGAGLWPLDSWAERRAEATSDWQGSTPAVVAREVEVVLSAMRSRPAWSARHVDRPMGHKQPATLSCPDPLPPLALVDQHHTTDSRLTAAARSAVQTIALRLERGEAPDVVVPDVVRELFCGGDATDGETSEWLAGQLLDDAGLRRVVTSVLRVIDGSDDDVRTG
ncbi:hypothetical protein [Lentzea sp.]|uniref:hypothetical protein n=1 Tax=Lentzea sp. TaxID=56099 RepID=UPI002ED16E2C